MTRARRITLALTVVQPQLPELSPAGDHCLRWSERRHSWRRVSDGGFDARRYEVAPVEERVARPFVVRHHYEGTYPAARFAYGLFQGGRLVGAAVLSVPAHAGVLTGVFPDLRAYHETLELGRLVLLDEVPANAESWFVARVFGLAERRGVLGVVSFSDPVPRTDVSGRVVFRGHVGTVYQASNALYAGRGTARTLVLLPDGSVLNERALAKVRADERGHAYVERRLEALGAPPRLAGEPGRAWLAHALADVGARLLRHGGCHRFAFRLGGHADRRATRIAVPALPYPKQVDPARTATAVAAVAVLSRS
jgi:hypothetical protein